MATAAYVDDVFDVVQALRRADATWEVIDRAPDADDSATATVDVYVETGELRSALAVQQALQLSFDAAAIVVEHGSREDDIERGTVEALLRDHIVELTLVELSAGSLRGRFTIDPHTEKGRRRLLAIGGVGVIALHFAFPPLAPILLGVGLVKELSDIVRPDALPPAQVEPKTVDPADIPPAATRVAVELDERTDKAADPNEVAAPPTYMYDVDIHGPADANWSFVQRVRDIDGVARESRAIIGEEYQRIRIWSSAPIDTDTLHRLAQEAGTEIL
jgi:hypothetical protein